MRKLMSTMIFATVVGGVGIAAQAADNDKPTKKRPNPERFFERRDANADGKLSLEEFIGKAPADRAERLKKRFARLDTDGDNAVSLEEFKNGFGPMAKGKAKGKGEKKGKQNDQ